MKKNLLNLAFPKKMNFAIKSKRVLLPQEGKKMSAVKPAVVGVEAGKVVFVERDLPVGFKGDLLDVGDSVVMPGIVDCHVHMNEPGRTEWEGIETATQAAAAGGITTLVDMPLNSIPPTTSIEALELKRASAKKTAYVDYGFWGGVIPGNEKNLSPLVDSGVLGFKAFLCESGVSEFPMSSESSIRKALTVLAKKKVPLLVHAEIESETPPSKVSSTLYESYLSSRPERFELDAIQKMIKLSKEFGCKVHIVHLSAASALPLIQEAKKEGIPISVETCPHYLTLKSEEISEKQTHFKCAPPIRNGQNQEGLWLGLTEGIIDFIVSDHSPCTPNLKKLEEGDFLSAWGGIAGLQFSLPVIWTEMRMRQLDIPQLSYWMSQRTSEFLKLSSKSGRIEVGKDADFVVWNPEESFELGETQIFHKHKLTPYLGRQLFGAVKKTFVRGNCVFDEGKIFGPQGQEVRR